MRHMRVLGNLLRGFAVGLVCMGGAVQAVAGGAMKPNDATPAFARYQHLHTFPPHVEGGRTGQNTQGPILLASDGNGYGTTCDGGRDDAGVVYRITPTNEVRTIYWFRIDSGARCPHGALIEGPDGAIYGVTSGVDSSVMSGTVFRADPAGTVRTVHRFRDDLGAYASGPVDGLVLASDGFFYGGSVGASGGLIYRLGLDGSYQVMHHFNRETDGRQPSGVLVQAADGFLYGVASEDGPYELGTLFRMSLAGEFEVVHAFGLDRREGYQPYGVALGPDGAIYGTNGWGGSSTPAWADLGGTLFRYALDGSFSVLYEFVYGQPMGYFPITAPVFDKAGNIYVTTPEGVLMPWEGDFAGAIVRIAPDGHAVIVHRFYGDGVYIDFSRRYLSMGPGQALYGTRTDDGVGTMVFPSQIFRITVQTAADGGRTARGR